MKVIYIDIDSLRPDHLGCYGYKRPTSPNLDKLASEGIRFTQCFTSDSPCMPSRAATISGTFGIRNGIVTHGDDALVLKSEGPTIPEVLRDHGIHTAAFSTFGRHPSPWFYGGWEEFYDPSGWDFQQTPAWKINDMVLPWLDEHAKEDFFLWVQYWDPHSVYEAPEGCVELVKDDSKPEFPTREQVESHQDDRFWHSAPMMGIHTYEDFLAAVTEYDAEIRYVDYYVGQLFKKLEALGIAEDTMIIVSADHGEGLGEHGVYVEHWSTSDTTNHIPLIVRYPKSIAAKQTSSALVYQIDIAATVCEAFGIAKPGAWDSQSLWPYFKDPSQNQRDYVVVGHGLYTAQRAVIHENWKLIRTLNSGEWDYPAVQLFDRENDPYEQNNVASQQPDIVNKLSGFLCEWEYSHMSPDGIDPLRRVAFEGPPGIRLYGEESVPNFKIHGVTEPIVFKKRKPEIPNG